VTLGETQALFHELVTGEADPDDERLERVFRGSGELATYERIGIYRGMYRARLVDALRETFPNLVRFLRDDHFTDLGEAYLRRHPSEHHDIGRFGRRLAAFLLRHPDPARPDLADLAALEWARNEVFFAAESAAAAPETLAALPPESAGAARLEMAPSLRVLSLAHDALALWRRLEGGEPPFPPIPGPSAAAVWRRGFEVFHCSLPLHEAAGLKAALRGASLAEVCSHFANRPDPSAEAHGALAGWFAEHWVARVRAPGC